MQRPSTNSSVNHLLRKDTALYREFLAERDEILRHKWLESEKAGNDIGFERALLDWLIKHRTNWRESRPLATAGRPDLESA